MAILIVEDDEPVGALAALFLQEAGLRTAQASSAHEAMKALARRPSDYTHVFADVHLADSLDGFALARMVRINWPQMRVLITSGDATVRERAVLYGMRYLPKPWARQDLLDAVLKPQ